MKKLLSLLLVLTMLLGMTAAMSVASAEELEPVTLKFIFYGDKKSETDTVWKAIAEKYKDVLNCDFDVQFIAGDDYNQKLLVKAAAGESWDLNFDSNWTCYYQMLTQEAYMDLSEMLPKYAPDLYAGYQASGALAAATDAEGRVTALPWTMVMNNRPHFQWRADLVEAAGIEVNPAELKTVEDVLELCRKLKAAFPDKYILENANLEAFMMKYNLADIGYGLCIDLTDPDCKVMPIESTAAYKERGEYAKILQDEGIIWGDVLTDKLDHNDLINQGILITKWGTHEFANQKRAWVEENARWGFADLYVDKLFANRTPLANALCIPDTAENPERTLMFLNLLETEQELYDLVHYGIEGLTYVLNGEEAVFPEGLNASNSNYMEWGGRWAMWKPAFMRPDASYDEGFWVREAEYATSNPNNVNNPLAGFNLNIDNINIEIAQREQIRQDADKLLDVGLVDDVEATINKLIEDQQIAGLDLILAEAQSQVDKYLGK